MLSKCARRTRKSLRTGGAASALAIVLRLADWEGLKARKKIAQGKASLRATPWVNRPQNFQALKGRQISLFKEFMELSPCNNAC